MDMSLYDHLKARKKASTNPRGLIETKAKEYLYQLLRGLEHLHRNGLFHRDVKPENILIKFPSTESTRLYRMKKYEIIKLADLGSVRGIYSVPPYTEYISTRWYRSPECLLTNGNYGPKMDVWAVGCVFYEMITLLPLFPGSNEIDQLSKIHQIVGSPPIQFLSKLKSRSRNCIVFPKERGTGVHPLLPHITRQGRCILELMIEYDHDKRINVKRLLNNCYFDDIRYKFEPTMEGNYKQYRKSKDFNKQNVNLNNIGVINSTYLKNKLSKERTSGSAKSDSKSSIKSSKSQTPSIEIPYYPAKRKSEINKKISSLPLIDYKISKIVEDHRRSNTSETDKSDRSKKSSLKRSVELILKSSRNSDSTNTPNSKSKTDRYQFHSRSQVIPKKKVSRTVHISSINDIDFANKHNLRK
ncbi:MAPK/MAK/MRK overlapping kinase-like isoform X2 [Sitophilus oryzae]|nr:MAPK/MAK/MRK overlapping kinase-like isoform X2 [Sitophilus oryzae]